MAQMSPERPQPLAVIPENIPAALKELPQWCVWKYVLETDEATGEQGWDKPPLCARGGSASSTDPKTWSTFEAALAAYRKRRLDGVGFVLHCPPDDAGPRLVAIDLDKCRDPQTGDIDLHWWRIAEDLQTYTEVSPSGLGLRLFAFGRLPPTGRKRGQFEHYDGTTLDGKPGGRYVTVTGRRVEGTPRTVELRQEAIDRVHAFIWPPEPKRNSSNGHHVPLPQDISDAELLEMAFHAKNGDDVRRLWRGEFAPPVSHSQADLSLCNHLAFWCGPGSEGRVADLFSQSGLFRSKWNREDYRNRTVAKAFAGRTDYYSAAGMPVVEFYSGNGHVQVAAVPSVPEAWEQPIPLNAPPAVPPFPVDVFPPPLRTYAAEVAWAVNAPVDFVGVPMLVASSGAIGNSRWLSITGSHAQPPVIFAAVVGRPGSGKSAPLDFVLAPLHAAEAEFYRQWEKAKKEWEDRDEADAKEPRPKLRRCLIDDTTVEALCRILSENPRGVLMARDELAALVTGMNQYRDGGKGSDRQIFLKIWSAAPIRVDRSKLEGIPLTVRRPCLPIIGGIQPGVIDWLKGEQKDDRPPPDDGFFDRFVTCYPGDLPAIGEEWREVSAEAANDWRCTIDALLGLEMDAEVGKERREVRPRLLSFTDEGRAAWARLTAAHAVEVNDATFPDWLRGPWQKLCPGYAGRLALVLQLLHWTCSEGSYDHVEARSVEDAFRLVAYFKAHARKVYAIMAADPCTREAAHVLRWLIRNPEVKAFSRRDAHRQLAHTFARSEALEAPLTRLVEHGYLRAIAVDQRPGPGRKASTRYEVNTLWERRRIDTIDGVGL